METQMKDALLRRDEVEKRTGLSRSHLFELIRRGDFPAAIPLAGRSRAWVESDVQGWIDARIAAGRKALS
jgi:prophage regulatory protein